MNTSPSTSDESLDKNNPEKYIRTFEGDIKTLKEGGVPDLAPLVPSHGASQGHPIVPPPSLPIPMPVSPPVQIPEPVSTPIPPVPIPDSTVHSASFAPPEFVRIPTSPQPPPQPASPPQLPPSSPRPASSLQTYAGDFLEQMKDTHSSSRTVLAAEQDSAKGAPTAMESQESLHTTSYIIAGSALLLAAGVGAYFAYATYFVDNKPTVLAPVVSAPIFVDERDLVSGVGPSLSQAIHTSVGRKMSAGAVRLLYIEMSTTTPGSVFSALRTSAPDMLVRNVRAQRSMAGVVNAGGKQSPFFILSVDSYSETFAGMLQWESKMPQDLKQLFLPYSTSTPTVVPKTQTTATTTATTATTTATTTSVKVGATSIPAVQDKQLKFRDEVVANHDVRIYRNAAGESVILYGYWNQTTLIIARDPGAFNEILERLATSRAQ